MIRPIADIEKLVSVGDPVRLSFERSIDTEDEIIKVEINPDTGFVTVFGSGINQDSRYLDWIFDVAGTQSVIVKINGDTTPIEETFTLEVISLEDDNLFCDDRDLMEYESEIIHYLANHRQTFKNTIRTACNSLIGKLSEDGIKDSSGDEYTRKAIEVKPDLKRWAVYETLQLIFEDQVQSIDSVFNVKAKKYLDLSKTQRRKMSSVFVDTDNDGTAETTATITPVFNGTLSRV